MSDEREQRLLRMMVERNASDLHLNVGSPSTLRIDEDLVAADPAPLTGQDTREMAYSLITPEQVKAFERERELDMSFGREHLGRFRVNISYQRGSVSVAVRLLPEHIRTFE